MSERRNSKAESFFSAYRTILPYMRQHRGRYLVGTLCIFGTSGAQLALPLFLRAAIDRMALDTFSISAVAWPMLGMVGAAIFVAAFRYYWRSFVGGAACRIESALRSHLFSHLMRLPTTFFRTHPTGDLMALATNDLLAIRMAVSFGIVALVDGLFMTAAILIIIFSIAPDIALYLVLPLPIVTVMVLFSGKFITRIFERVQKSFAHLGEIVRETMQGIRVVKSYTRERYFNQRFEVANEDYRRNSLSYARIWALLFPLATFISGITLFLLLWFGGSAVIDGGMGLGTLVALVGYLQMLLWPMLGAGITVNLLARGASSLRRINEVLNQQPLATPKDGRKAMKDSAISVRNLTFAHDERVALHDISFEVPAGGMLGILGDTGGGKTTLIQMLTRVIDPPPGALFVGGSDVHDYDIGALRAQFGVVPQEATLFSTSIRENIAFGLEIVDDGLIAAAGGAAALGRDIDDLADGWWTMVGERGVTLSGGQRQRVAIARALILNAPILLIDDALSAVDTETEERILTALAALRENKTTIIISHRVSAFDIVDQVIVLQQGVITQRGTPEQLTRQEGYYRTIHELQRLERAK